jgi:hypothetical protein
MFRRYEYNTEFRGLTESNPLHPSHSQFGYSVNPSNSLSYFRQQYNTKFKGFIESKPVHRRTDSSVIRLIL